MLLGDENMNQIMGDFFSNQIKCFKHEIHLDVGAHS